MRGAPVGLSPQSAPTSNGSGLAPDHYDRRRMETALSLRRFAIDIDGGVIDDLRARIHRTRWPEPAPGEPWSQGTDLVYLQDLLAYWADGFDWPAQQRRLNAYEHYLADIDGIRIHFVHRRCSPAGIPVVLTHGWPSTFAELLPLADRLHGFDVVVPSLPGYAFSSRPPRVGVDYRHVATLWHRLMIGLGYERYAAHGGDFGAGVTSYMALTRPERMLGIHLSTAELAPYTGPGSPPLTDAEIAYVGRLDSWAARERGYSSIQSTKPQTVGYGLTDSPAGLAAWIVEKWRSWADSGGDLDDTIGRDDLLTTLTLYWVTASITTSMRDYYDNRWHGHTLGAADRIRTPTAMAVFANEYVPEGAPPREWYERLYDIRRWTIFPHGGHFAATEQPDLVARDIVAFLADLSR
jgi:pimeloyl-ACP methyl ester carboxylesterase